MKILLVQPLSYLFAAGGAHKANRILMEGLAERGFDCWVISPIELDPTYQHMHLSDAETYTLMLEELAKYDVELISADDPSYIVYRLNGVTVYAVQHGLTTFSRTLSHVLHTFHADWIVVTEDRSSLLLEMTLEHNHDRVVYLAHSQATLPFGPEAFEKDEVKAAVYQRLQHIIVVSRYLQDYFKQWANLPSTILRFPSYGTGPYPFLANFNTGYVTMINPSTLKGGSIFIQLAKTMPDVEFAVVPSWATTMRERTMLEHLPNVHFLQRSSNMNDVLQHVRVLLVPSLWGESFGQVCVDALLRGIPVIASHVGGLPEATLGAGLTVPVNPITGYRNIRISKQMPIPIVPAQDIQPWQTTLRRVLSDAEYYDQLAQASYQAAAEFVAGLSIDHFAQYFHNLEAQKHSATTQTSETTSNQATLANLSPERRALLAQRLSQLRRERA